MPSDQPFLHSEELSFIGSGWVGPAFWEIERSHWLGLVIPRLRAWRRGPGPWTGTQDGHSAPTHWTG